MLVRRCAAILGLALLPAAAAAQEPARIPADPAVYTPPTGRDRVKAVIEGTVSPADLTVNLLDAAWSTHVNWPAEWGRSTKGFSKRFADDEAYAALSGTIEAGVGTLWGEDPRYRRSDEHGAVRRLRHSLVATLLAPRRDGHLAPAWARYTAIAATIRIENTWLPPTTRTPESTAWRAADDLIWRAASNVWDEFWPDLRKRLPARR